MSSEWLVRAYQRASDHGYRRGCPRLAAWLWEPYTAHSAESSGAVAQTLRCHASGTWKEALTSGWLP